jgi:hypothetical protein
MNPKSGKASTAVAPADPKPPDEADKADPGEVEKAKAEQRQTKTGKYGSVQVKPYKPPQTKEEKEKKNSWIEIEMVDEEDQPLPGVAYRILLPDGETVAEGTLDQKGCARVEGIEAGNCQVSFPGLDQETWNKT